MDSQITITQFTDPLCTWSWEAEPTLRWLQERYRGQVTLEFVLGGLTGEPTNAATSIELSSQWQRSARRSGMPIDLKGWQENSPNSSCLASIAYKAAEFQDETLADDYLRRMREAAATERKNIERREILVALAGDVGLDETRLASDLASDHARAAFKENVQRTRESPVTAFPTFRIDGEDDTAWVQGNQPVEKFERAFDHLATDLDPIHPRPIREFIDHYGRVATQEVAEVYEIDVPKAEQVLKAMADRDRTRPIDRGNGRLWTTE